jgi:heat shock protein HslJ
MRIRVSSLALSLTLGVALLGCSNFKPAQRELTIASAPVPCAGAPAATCLKVTELDGDTWRMEFDEIEGFAYEPGHTYRVLVEEPPLSAEMAVMPQLSLVRVLSEEPTKDRTDASPLARNDWRLQSISGASGGGNWSASGITAAFYVGGGWVDGFAGCNSYLGALSIRGDKITMSDPATTLEECAGAMEDRQQTYLDALTKAQSYEVSDDQLELTLSNGGKMQFRADRGSDDAGETSARAEAPASRLSQARR